MNNFFKNKVVAVTGGSDGIGKALVEKLIIEGAFVSTCGRNHEKLLSLEKYIQNERLCIFIADVSIKEDCENFIQHTISTFGKIDILINNAGISMRSMLIDCDINVIKKLMDINFLGAVYCTKFALENIIQNKGSIVGISSIAGYRGLPGRSGYSASKFALNGWLESIRTELSPFDVNVMWVCPGFTKSNIRNAALNQNAVAQGESPLNENSLMSAEDCASSILTAIQKKKRTLILTFQGKETIWLNKFFPTLTDFLIRKFFFKKGILIK
jgi:short-subunit dehydrogenase